MCVCHLRREQPYNQIDINARRGLPRIMCVEENWRAQKISKRYHQKRQEVRIGDTSYMAIVGRHHLVIIHSISPDSSFTAIYGNALTEEANKSVHLINTQRDMTPLLGARDFFFFQPALYPTNTLSRTTRKLPRFSFHFITVSLFLLGDVKWRIISGWNGNFFWRPSLKRDGESIYSFVENYFKMILLQRAGT